MYHVFLIHSSERASERKRESWARDWRGVGSTDNRAGWNEIGRVASWLQCQRGKVWEAGAGCLLVCGFRHSSESWLLSRSTHLWSTCPPLLLLVIIWLLLVSGFLFKISRSPSVEDICTGVEHSMHCQRNYKLLIEVPLRIIFLLFCLIFHT